MTAPSPPLAVSSWSLHRTLGLTFPNRPDHDVATPTPQPTYGEGRISLLDMPELVRGLGIDRVEICSFHIANRDPVYLAELRAALAASGITLQTLLVEYGDITNPATAERDLAWIGRWIETAAELGAEQARVIAGKAKHSAETLGRSVVGLRRLARQGETLGVRIVTENWFDFLSTPAEVHSLFYRLDGAVGLNGDFGNWSGPGKYEDLKAIFRIAICCHAKGDFSDGQLDEEDYANCLAAATAAGFRGPYTLIYDGSDPDEIANLAIERDFIRNYFA
ncbi:sugar phosphate isomerase/epimerase family protein [Kaistia algarum]|uniref:sugar phosphate isomerase/epimerase family protein n=1 Tax=Kaistia algarum TaxID=2083279 RepID=UPI00224FAD40|nr:TIM barrel protein [Kaistia algarum]MCX5513630.1 TIM barrel protein [Kaistia algarum]